MANAVKTRSRSRFPLSTPDRVYFPDSGITKRELADYYEAAADRILPELVRRPLNWWRRAGALSLVHETPDLLTAKIVLGDFIGRQFLDRAAHGGDPGRLGFSGVLRASACASSEYL